MKVKKLLNCFLVVALVIAVCFIGAACGKEVPADPTPSPTPTPGGDEDEFYVVELSILTPPEKTTYLEGEEFDYTGMTLKAVWNDEEEETLHPLECEITPEGPLTADVTEITLTYEGKSVTQEITVSSATVTGIEMNSETVEKNVVVGATVNCGSLTVSAIIDGNKRDVTSQCTFTLNDVAITDLSAVVISKDGDNIIKAKYQEFEAQFIIKAFIGKVIEAENIVSEVTPDLRDYVTVVNSLEGGQSFTVQDIQNGETASGDQYVGDVKKGGIMTFNIYSDVAASTDIILRAANGYMTEGNGWNPIVITEVKFNEIFSVKINGEEFSVSDDVVLPGSSTDNPKGDWSLWTNWVDVSFGTVDLLAGNNTIELTVISEKINSKNFSCAANIDRLEIRYNAEQ